MCQKKLWLVLLLIILPERMYAQLGIPDSVYNDENARWKVVLEISYHPFTTSQVTHWQKISKHPVTLYKNTEGEYRAVIDAPPYWVQSVNFRDSLIALGISDARLVKLYANRYAYQYWNKQVDFGDRIE